MSACIEKNALTLFINIAIDQSCIENQIVTRQLAVRNIRHYLVHHQPKDSYNMYDLPSAYDFLENPPSKEKMEMSTKRTHSWQC